jgi:hypothetical protein
MTILLLSKKKMVAISNESRNGGIDVFLDDRRSTHFVARRNCANSEI